MELVCVGISHHTAPLELRERLALTPESRAAFRERLASGGDEVLVLDTCNRLEVYTACTQADAFSAKVRTEMEALGGPEVGGQVYEQRGEAAVVHLFRVAASLDSMVLGEPQILGQLKAALTEAREAGTARAELVRVCSAAFGSAKRVRSETAIGRVVTSMASVAVSLAQKVFEGLAGRTILMLGAGAMGKLAAKSLLGAGVSRALVTSRTLERAQQLAALVQGEPRTLDALPSLLVEADVVVCSTASPTPLVRLDMLRPVMKARRHRPLFFLDLAVPRDVHPEVASLDGVYVFDLDDVQRAQSEGASLRAAEALEAEQIVAEEVARWAQMRAERTGTPMLAQLRAHAESIARAEAERTLSQLGDALTDRQRKSVEAMALAIVNKLLHAPTARLRAVVGEDDQELVDAAAELFGLEEATPRGRGAKG
jgi:glutamyl-tRNA reductase